MITGCGYVIVKLSLREFDSYSFAFWRFVIGLFALIAVVLVRKVWPRIERKDWPRVFVLALLAIPINQLIYMSAMHYTVPSHASLIYGSTAAFALLMSVIAGYERFKIYKLAAIALAIGGLVIVLMQAGNSVLDRSYLKGDLLVFLAMISWAAYTVAAKPIVKKYGAVSLSMFCLILGSLIAIPFLIPSAISFDYSRVTWIGILGVCYTGIMLTAVAYTVWFALIKQIDPSQVAILTAPQPVVATVISAIVIGEVIGLSIVLGGILVIAGVVMMDFPALMARTNSRFSKAK